MDRQRGKGGQQGKGKGKGGQKGKGFAEREVRPAKPGLVVAVVFPAPPPPLVESNIMVGEIPMMMRTTRNC